MTDPQDEPWTSRLRFIVKELAILAIGLIVLFVALGFIVSMLGVTMCCQ